MLVLPQKLWCLVVLVLRWAQSRFSQAYLSTVMWVEVGEKNSNALAYDALAIMGEATTPVRLVKDHEKARPPVCAKSIGALMIPFLSVL